MLHFSIFFSVNLLMFFVYDIASRVHLVACCVGVVIAALFGFITVTQLLLGVMGIFSAYIVFNLYSATKTTISERAKTKEQQFDDANLL